VKFRKNRMKKYIKGVGASQWNSSTMLSDYLCKNILKKLLSTGSFAEELKNASHIL